MRFIAFLVSAGQFIARLTRDRGDAARARDLWQQALRIYEAIEDPNAERVRGWLAGL
jgi:hypothetical protein